MSLARCCTSCAIAPLDLWQWKACCSTMHARRLASSHRHMTCRLRAHLRSAKNLFLNTQLPSLLFSTATE